MQTFSEFARVNGVLIKDLFASSRIQRCPTVAHERSTNGAYYWDGDRGWVMAWDGDGLVHWYGGEGREWTDAEKRDWARRQDVARQQKIQKQQQAAMRAKSMLMDCRQDKHGYLHLKGFPDLRSLVMPDDSLFVPMRDVHSNALLGAQLIHWDAESEKWVKKMIPGMRAKGAVLRIGPAKVTETVLCEGYATGLSIDAALRHLRLQAAVLVCFSDSNMRYVADMVPGKKYAFADNDVSEAGEKAAQQAGIAYCMSDVLGEDANDMHQRAGVFAVAAKLMETRRRA